MEMKGTLQVWMFISKLGFWIAKDGRKLDPSKKKGAMAIFFFHPKSKICDPKSFLDAIYYPPLPHAPRWGPLKGRGGEQCTCRQPSKKKPKISNVMSVLTNLQVTTEAYIWGFWSTHGRECRKPLFLAIFWPGNYQQCILFLKLLLGYHVFGPQN